MPRHRLSPISALLGILLATIAGCARPSAVAPWPATATSPPRTGVASSEIYAQLFAGQPTSRTYTDASGDLVVENVSRESETLLRVERLLVPADDTPTTSLGTRWFSANPNGEVLLRRSYNPQRDIEIVYEPALVVAPETLRPGEAHASESAITSIEGNSRQTGSAAYELELVGERLAPGGTRETHIRSTLVLTLGRSTVTRRTDRLLSIDASGSSTVLREDSLETVRVFGLTVSTNRRSLASRLDRTDAD